MSNKFNNNCNDKFLGSRKIERVFIFGTKQIGLVLQHFGAKNFTFYQNWYSLIDNN